MDDLALGRLFRELRLRLNWRQAEVAARAGISRSAYSEIERGAVEHVPIGKLRMVAATLEVRVVLEARWRGAAIDRVTSSRHAAMSERVVRMLVNAGWEVQPEVSFNHYGERGVVDAVGWHAQTSTMLLIELKTELADINNLLAVTGRRLRLAATIGEPLGWKPARVAQWLVVASSRTNERCVAAHRALLRAAFPDDGRAIRGWLAAPDRELSALWFLPDSALSSTRRSAAPRLRASPASRSVRAPDKAA